MGKHQLNSGHIWTFWKALLPPTWYFQWKESQWALSWVDSGGLVEIRPPSAVLPIFWLAAHCETRFSETGGLIERGDNHLLPHPLGMKQVTGCRQENEPENKRWCHYLEPPPAPVSQAGHCGDDSAHSISFGGPELPIGVALHVGAFWDLFLPPWANACSIKPERENM